jgi:Tol biopolymer transport system component
VGQNADLWVKDLDRDTSSRLTFLDGTATTPVWTPDGKHIVFTVIGTASYSIYTMRADGGGEPVALKSFQRQCYPASISPDGKYLAYFEESERNFEVRIAPLERSGETLKLGEPRLFAKEAGSQTSPTFSGDGRWMAYTYSEAGKYDVIVRPFPGPGGRWQIVGGGSNPRWTNDGRSLIYISSANTNLSIVDCKANGDTITFSKPRVWADVRIPTDRGVSREFDVLPDGKHAAVLQPSQIEMGAAANRLTILFHFGDELTRKFGAK